MDKLISEPSAIVGGGAAWLISRVLRSPNIAKVLARPQTGLDRADIAATIEAIHHAARVWENRVDQRQRDNADPLTAVVPQCLTIEQAASYLGLSRRRVQELAPALAGTRIGGRWRIPAVAVRLYGERSQQREVSRANRSGTV